MEAELDLKSDRKRGKIDLKQVGEKSSIVQRKICQLDLICYSNHIKVVTAKLSLSLSISVHTWVMESPQLGPRVKLFESFSSFNALTLGPSLRDSITQVWSEIERLIESSVVTPFRSHIRKFNRNCYSVTVASAV